MDNGLPCTDCKMSYTWQRCNADIERLRRHSGAHRLHLSARCRRRRAGGSASSSGSSSATAVRTTTPRAPGVPGHHEERRVRRRRRRSCRSRSTTATVHRYARGAGNRRWRTRSCARPATWTGPGTITKAFFWQRCNTAGEGCFTIPGATGAAYRLTAADVDTRIRVVETAANEGGASQAVSTLTDGRRRAHAHGEPADGAVAKVTLPHRLAAERGGHAAEGRQP